MLQKHLEENLFCRCKLCHSENVHVNRRFFPNIVTYPFGLGLFIMMGIQPLPVKMVCNDCNKNFFGSGIHH